MTQGWKKESKRHSLARKGIRTTEVKNPTFDNKLRKLFDKAYTLGYDTASGKAGTGWMKFTDSDIEHVKTLKPDGWEIDKNNTYNQSYQFAEDWFETLQFDYEFRHIKNELEEIGYPDTPDDESHMWRMLELKGQWASGYADYIEERLKTVKK